MTEQRDGLLWRLARLHPAWVTLIVWLGYFVYGGYTWWFEAVPALAAASFTGFMLLYMGYPLFVLLFLPGRFRTWSPPRRGRAVAAFVANEVLVVTSLFVQDTFSAVVDAANSGDLAAILAFGVFLSILAFSFFYLIIGAALVLVAAERGRASRKGRKFWTSLQFLYLPFCVFFIHRRIRRLIRDFNDGDPLAVNLPMEKLEMRRDTVGHLSLELTERPGWEDFERYATELLRRLDGRVLKRVTVVDTHLWKIQVETVPLRLVYEDFPNRVNLESDSYPGDILLKKLQTRLAPAS